MLKKVMVYAGQSPWASPRALVWFIFMKNAMKNAWAAS